MSTDSTNRNQLGPLVRVAVAKVHEAHRVQVTFEDGTTGETDFEPFLSAPVFEPMRHDPIVSRPLAVHGGMLAWPNGADIDPDVLYHELTPAWMEITEEA